MHGWFHYLRATALHTSDDAITVCILNAIYANAAARHAVKLPDARC